MKVIYRMCGIPSTNPSPVLQEDKFALNKLCLRSFVAAFKRIDPHMTILCDYCEPEHEYAQMIANVVPFEVEIQFSNIGINNTCLKAYEIAKMFKDQEVILFQECDYLYRPAIGLQFEEAIMHFGLVSPYDHLNFYLDASIHSPSPLLEVFNNYHYRLAERNTMTFGITADLFKKHYDIFYKYGYLDSDVWHDLAAQGVFLWTPLPAFSTHMVKDFLAPGIDWQKEWGKYL